MRNPLTPTGSVVVGVLALALAGMGASVAHGIAGGAYEPPRGADGYVIENVPPSPKPITDVTAEGEAVYGTVEGFLPATPPPVGTQVCVGIPGEPWSECATWDGDDYVNEMPYLYGEEGQG